MVTPEMKLKFVVVFLIVLVIGLTNRSVPPMDTPSVVTPWKAVLGLSILGSLSFLVFPVHACAMTGICLTTGALVDSSVVAGAATWALMETAGSVRANPLTPCTLPMIWGGWPMAVCHDRDRGWVFMLPHIAVTDALCPRVDGNILRIIDLLLLRSDLGFGCFVTENGTVLKIGYLFIAVIMGIVTFLRNA